MLHPKLGLAIGGLVVGAMAADAALNNRNNNRQKPTKPVQCICKSPMKAGLIQQGSPKCDRCYRPLVKSYCYYCPIVINSHLHPNGYFLCEKCASVRPKHHRSVSLPHRNDPNHQNKHFMLKEGFMQKKGEIFTAFKKRWFRLYNNRRMSYSESASAKHVKGYCDFLVVNSMQKKGKMGFEVRTPKRNWVFLCGSTKERDDWFHLIQQTCHRKHTGQHTKSSSAGQNMRHKSQSVYPASMRAQVARPMQPNSSMPAYNPDYVASNSNNNYNDTFVNGSGFQPGMQLQPQPGMIAQPGVAYDNNNPPPAYAPGCNPNASNPPPGM